MQITLNSIGTVTNTRREPGDDFWGTVISEIELSDHIPTEAFEGIESFSHLEIIYSFNQVDERDVVFSGKPRGNPSYPTVGIFAQRKKDRPNTLGLCTVELISHTGRKIRVKYLDALNGTPVLDIKPVMREFQPTSEIRQPAWAGDLMRDYWK